ncbi:MAG: hypothetical protein AAB423_03505 [Patescibacteria group bacterium]
MDTTDAKQEESSAKSISWTASEFANSHKNAGWYLLFFGGLTGVCALLFIVARDFMASISIFVAGLLFLVLTAKKPRSMQYVIDAKGLGIGSKFYNFSSFKSFNLTDNNGIANIDFIPMRRFAPEISIFLPPEQGQDILGIISEHLPHDERKENKIDQLSKKLKF